MLLKGKFDSNFRSLSGGHYRKIILVLLQIISITLKTAAELSSFTYKPSNPQPSRNFGNRSSYIDTGFRGGFHLGGYQGSYRGCDYDNSSIWDTVITFCACVVAIFDDATIYIKNEIIIYFRMLNVPSMVFEMSKWLNMRVHEYLNVTVF